MRFLLHKALVGLARKNARASRWRLAILSYRGALALVPTAPAWLQLGHAWKEARNHEQALLAYSRSLELDPNNYDCRTHHAHLSRVLGRPQFLNAMDLENPYLTSEEATEHKNDVETFSTSEDMTEHEGASNPFLDHDIPLTRSALVSSGIVVDPRSYANSNIIRSSSDERSVITVRRYLQHIPFFNIESSRFGAQGGAAESEGQTQETLPYGEIMLLGKQASRDLRCIGEGASIVQSSLSSERLVPPAQLHFLLRRPMKSAEANLRLLVGVTSKQPSRLSWTIKRGENSPIDFERSTVELAPLTACWISMPIKFDPSGFAAQSFVLSFNTTTGETEQGVRFHAICLTDGGADELWRGITEKISWYDYPTIREIEIMYNTLNIDKYISNVRQ